MSTRLEDGDLILYTKLSNDYKEGDAVVYEIDGIQYVSSILAQPGDLIELDEKGHLHINGTQSTIKGKIIGVLRTRSI